MWLINKIKMVYWKMNEMIDSMYLVCDEISYLKRLMYYDKISERKVNSKDWLGDNKLIAHAMGAIDGINYTNSLEAFEKNYAQGIRIFELDVCLTEEKIPVLCHEWGPYNKGNLVDWRIYCQNPEKYSNVPLKYQEFVSTKILGKYTPLTLSDIVHLAEKYEDTKYIISAKSKVWEYDNSAKIIFISLNELIQNSKYEINDNFIIQIHSKSYFEYLCQDCNFNNFILGIRPGKMRDEDELDGVLTKIGVSDILINARDIDNMDIKKMISKGVRVIAHTVNTKEEYQLLTEKGIKGILTDYLTP